MILRSLIIGILLCYEASCFWEMGTTTVAGNPNEDLRPRQSVFRWQMTQGEIFRLWFWWWDWKDLRIRRRLAVVCGLSIHMTNLGTCVLLNRRTVMSAANLIEPWKDQESSIRIWALGRGGNFKTPWRYRVWKAQRLIPRSNNPEHWHGARGVHVPRHDVSIIHSMDQIYLYPYLSRRYHYAFRARVYNKHDLLPDYMIVTGSGFEDLLHIRENYKIYYRLVYRSQVVDCSKYLPKWWGKFICFRNPTDYQTRMYGVPNGGALLTYDMWIPGLGCFEIRYNEDKILVFTDLRYYTSLIYMFANITMGEYYDYAYQYWGTFIGIFYDGSYNRPFIPVHSKQKDLFPLGK